MAICSLILDSCDPIRAKGPHVRFGDCEFRRQRSFGGRGVITLTRVKHRRELLFASLPTLFAIHQFIEGFVWLGLDGILSPNVTRNMGRGLHAYAQGPASLPAPPQRDSV